MALVKVPVVGTIGKVVSFDPQAGTRAEAAVAALRTEISKGVGGTIFHSALKGLQVGDDHPQYTMWQGAEQITGQWNFSTIPNIQGDTLAEYIEDVIGRSVPDFLQDTTSIHWTYHDTSNLLEANVQDEYVQDTVGAMLLDTTSIDLTYDDATGKISAAIIDEYVQDLVATMVGDSTTIDFTYSDLAGTLTASVIQSFSYAWTANHSWDDNHEVRLGTGNDLRLFHDGTDSWLRNDTGILKISQGANVALQFNTSRAWGVDGANYGTSGQVLTSNGSSAAPSWQTGSGGGGSWSFINETSVAGAAATNITISSLDIGTDECYYVQIIGAGAAAGTANLSLFFNGDTTAANYERSINGSAADNAVFGGAFNSAPLFYSFFIRRDPVTGRVFAVGNGGRYDGTNQLDQNFNVLWDTSANLTSFTINSSVASQIAIGTMVRVWRIIS